MDRGRRSWWGLDLLVACCSDSDGRVFRDIAAAIADERPDLVLFAGDARARGFGVSPRRARKWLQNRGPLADRVLTVPGNHDYSSAASAPWTWTGQWEGSGSLNRFDRRALFSASLELTVLGLDTGADGLEVDRAQLDWVDAQDMGTGPRVAVFHAPAFPTSLHIGSSLDAHPTARDGLLERLASWRVALVINGHEHLYARRLIGGDTPITQLITGGGGAELYSNASSEVIVARSEHHFVLLDVAENRIAATSLTPDGQIVDQFSVFPSGVGRDGD